jgi:hypothetical protein
VTEDDDGVWHDHWGHRRVRYYSSSAKRDQCSTESLLFTPVAFGRRSPWQRSSEVTENSSAVLPAVVEKIIKLPHEPEKAQVAVEGEDDQYREIRIENTLIDENGREVSLKPGAEVEVTVQANTQDTIPKA